MRDVDLTRSDITIARSYAVRQHRGQTLQDYERNFMNAVCEAMSPENFYQDGELFANH